MIIKIKIPNTLPEGHGLSFKKGIAEALLENAPTSLGHTPNGHGKSRESGKSIGRILASEIAEVVKPVDSKK